MEFINFLKERWNLVLGFSLALVTVVSEFVIRPDISFYIAEGAINYESLAKFIVSGIILILLVPCSLYKERKHLSKWWPIAIFTFVIAMSLFFYYNREVNRVTAYNEYTGERVVIGQTLTPKAGEAVDAAKRHEGIDLSPAEMLASLGTPIDIWKLEGLHVNSRNVIVLYLITLTTFCLFILFSIQAVYCINQPKAI